VELARGEAARLVVTSDIADELHVHGGIGFVPKCPPACRRRSTPRSMNRRVYYAELHLSGLQLLQFEVR
jgi:hypothetical protein